MALRSFCGAPKSIVHVDSYLEKPGTILVNVSSRFLSRNVVEEKQRLISSLVFQKQSLQVKASNNTSILTTNAVTNEKNSNASMEKNILEPTFPSGLQTLVEEVCDQTDIAELKLKVGDFEMLLKRDLRISAAPSSVLAPIEPPLATAPVPSTSMVETDHSSPPVMEQKSTAAASSPFTISEAKSSKLEALKASGQDSYVLVASPMVGTFQRGRKVKGIMRPPSCIEGAMVKEGQTIGFFLQFGNQVPVKSDVSGEVVKILVEDGDAVGYGDPIIAVLPLFHGI